MNPVSSTCLPRVGDLGALLMAASVLAGCGDDGSGTDSANTDATTAASAGTDAPTTTGEPTTAADGSSGGDSSTGAAAVSYADIQKIWDAHCTLGCHMPGGTGTIQTTLDLSAGVSYAQIVDMTSSQAPTLPRVAPGDHEGSYLWHKLKNTQVDVNGSGYQMPTGGLMDPAELAMIEKWIDDGALP